MNDFELDEIRSDLKEIKEMMKVISRQVAADTEVAAIRTERRMSEEKRQADVLSVINKNRQLLELAD